MVDLTKSWVRFRTLPDDVLETMPGHVRETFLAARRDGFEVEMVCAGAKIPAERRAARRFVLVADDMGEPGSGGPLRFDLAGLAADVHAAKRLFVLSSTERVELYATAYAAAVEDLSGGFRSALVVETRSQFAAAWVRTLSAIQEGRAFGAAVVGDESNVQPRNARRRAKRTC